MPNKVCFGALECWSNLLRRSSFGYEGRIGVMFFLTGFIPYFEL